MSEQETKTHGIIYRLTNTTNGLVYVGQTTDVELKDRMWWHQKPTKRQMTPIKRAVEEFGFAAFTVDVLEKCQDQATLDAAEIRWIDVLNATDPAHGYNLRAGGAGGGKFNQEAKANIAAAHVGKPSGKKGKIVSDETKERISQTMTGMVRGPTSEETKKKISDACTGKKRKKPVRKPLSEEHKAKLRQRRLADIAANRKVESQDAPV